MACAAHSDRASQQRMRVAVVKSYLTGTDSSSALDAMMDNALDLGAVESTLVLSDSNLRAGESLNEL